MTAFSWLEYYTLQSMAFQNAFADLNADAAAGRIPCPVASCNAATYVPIVHASAFAQASFSGVSTASTGASPYAATYRSDYYPYFGQMTVVNEHTQFPVSTATGVQALTKSASVQNMRAFSLHSYGAR